MKQFETSISVGNARGLSRSRDDVRDSLEIVPDISHDSFSYDSFAFLMTDVDEFVSDERLLDFFGSETHIGTGTLSCFEYDNKILGGFVVSVPFDESLSVECAESMFRSYRDKFGERLSDTVSSYPTDSYAKPDSLTADLVGLSEFEKVDLLNETAECIENTDIPVYTFGFISEGTLNILYLVSEDDMLEDERFSAVVRQLDTMVVFSNPEYRLDVSGTVFVPCERVLSSVKVQSYLESEYRLSEMMEFNLGNLDSPELYVDSVLEFSFSPELSNKQLSVSCVGSRNANAIERRLRNVSSNVQNIDVSDLVVVESGAIGERRDTGGDVFVGQTYVDWSCGCDVEVCPTVVSVTSQSGVVTEEDVKKIDELLREVEGQTPFEVNLEGVVLDDFIQA